MSSYDQLLADVQAWTTRDDLLTVLPSLVRLAEDVHLFGRRLFIGPTPQQAPRIRVRAQLKRDATITIPAGNGRFLDFPSDYLDMRRLRLLSSRGPKRLDYVAPENLSYATANEPSSYTLHEQIEFNSDGAEGHTFELLYYAPFDRVTPANQTNWLIVNAYGCYLYGTLVEVGLYTEDDEMTMRYLKQYVEAASAVQDTDDKSDKPRGRMQVRLQRAPSGLE